MKYLFSFSEPGKAAAYIKRVTLDLVRARRETQNAEKVCNISGKIIVVTEYFKWLISLLPFQSPKG